MSTLVSQLLSQTHYLADGSQTIWNFSFSGGYIDTAHVKAYTKSPAGTRVELVITDLSFVGPFQLNILPAVSNGYELVIYRDTPKTAPLVNYEDGAQVDEFNLDRSNQQAIFVAAEMADYFGSTTSADLVALGQQALASAGAAAASAASATSQASAANASAISAAASAASALVSANTASAVVTAFDTAIRSDLSSTVDASKGAGMEGYKASLSYAPNTIGRELKRWLSLDHFVTDTTGTTDVASQINTAIAVAVSVGAVGIYGSPTSTYRIQSKIDLMTARNLTFDFRGATLIDDVRTFRGDLGGRGDHAFRMYASSGVEVCNLIYTCAATRAVLTPGAGAPSIAFWIGGQSEGNLLTQWARVRNVVASTPIVGLMFASIVGEAAGVEISGIQISGRWNYGINLEYGDIPVDPATNNTITNGLHPYNILVGDVRGYDLIDCMGFLRTASTYNVKFSNCQGSNVRNFIYVYTGDRNISRFSQNVIFENCKSKVESSAALTAANYDVQILSVNLDGSTLVPLPAFTNYRHIVRFVGCEFQSGNRTNNASVRFYGTKGKAVFEQCIFRDTYQGVLAGPTTNPTYTSTGVLSFRDCLFVNNHQDININTAEGVIFENTRFEDQNVASVLATQVLVTAVGVTYKSCRFSGKAATSPNWYIDMSSSNDARFYDNVFTMLNVAHYAIKNTDSRMKGFGNLSNGLLVNRNATSPGQLVVRGMVGEMSTMYRDMLGVTSSGGSVITYECGAMYEVSTTETVSRVIGGQVGDVLQFRAIGGGANVTFTFAAGGVPTSERIINKSGVTDNPTGALWSKRYQKFDAGWLEV